MPLGPGIYDDLATSAREAAGAEGVVLIILGGQQGSGFSAQLSRPGTYPAREVLSQHKLAALLRDLADQIDKAEHK
jgi:hypothetical protein